MIVEKEEDSSRMSPPCLCISVFRDGLLIGGTTIYDTERSHGMCVVALISTSRYNEPYVVSDVADQKLR